MVRSAEAKRSATAILFPAAIGLAVLLNGCKTALHPYIIAGDSMAPLFRPGDRIFVDETETSRSDLHDGDVIALRRGDAIVVKRILAMPGETIRGEHRKVFRDGMQLNEPYVAPATGEEIDGLATFPSRKVGAEEMFLLGDNRDRSLDSRADEYAPVRFSDVVGKYSWTYWHGSTTAK